MKVNGKDYHYDWLVVYFPFIWLVVSIPLKNMKVNGKDDIPYMKWKIIQMFRTTNQSSCSWPKSTNTPSQTQSSGFMLTSCSWYLRVHISLTMDHAETPRRDPMIKVSQLQTYSCSGHTFHTQQPNANGINGINGEFHRKYLPRSQNAFCERRLFGGPSRVRATPNGADLRPSQHLARSCFVAESINIWKDRTCAPWKMQKARRVT